MTTIPKDSRDTARQKLIPFLPYLGEKDYRFIAAEIGDTTAGMVKQVAIGNRWTIAIFDALLKRGEENKAKLAGIIGGAAQTTASTTVDSPPVDDAPKKPKKGQKKERAKNPAEAIPA